MENETPGNETQTSTEELMTKLTARLASAVELLEKALLERALPQASLAASADDAVGPIVAMVDASSRETELARKLAEAEKTIAELRASSTQREGRRTLPVSLAAKQDGAAPEPAALDAALSSLSLEQRITVKAQLLRSGLV
jgi:hypothetical protein